MGPHTKEYLLCGPAIDCKVLQAQMKRTIRFENQTYNLKSPEPSQDVFPTAQCLALISHLSSFEAHMTITRGQIEVCFHDGVTACAIHICLFDEYLMACLLAAVLCRGCRTSSGAL